MVSDVRLLAVLIADTVTEYLTAILVSVSPETTVYLRTVALGDGLAVAVAVGAGVAVGFGVAVAVGFGDALAGGDALGVGDAVGLVVGAGDGSTTVAPALRPAGMRSARR